MEGIVLTNIPLIPLVLQFTRNWLGKGTFLLFWLWNRNRISNSTYLRPNPKEAQKLVQVVLDPSHSHWGSLPCLGGHDCSSHGHTGEVSRPSVKGHRNYIGVILDRCPCYSALIPALLNGTRMIFGEWPGTKENQSSWHLTSGLQACVVRRLRTNWTYRSVGFSLFLGWSIHRVRPLRVETSVVSTPSLKSSAPKLATRLWIAIDRHPLLFFCSPVNTSGTYLLSFESCRISWVSLNGFVIMASKTTDWTSFRLPFIPIDTHKSSGLIMKF